MTGTRKEHDSLGFVEVPSEALYGAQTVRALQNYRISHRTAHPALIRAYLRIKTAAAITNAEAGILQKGTAELITRAAGEVIKKDEKLWREYFPVDAYQAGAGTSQNMNMNEVLANIANRIAGKALGTYAPVHPNDHVNCSQSTNDTYPTAMRLALLDASNELNQQLSELSQAFGALGKRWQPFKKSARTHLQDAVPMRLGQEFTAYSATLQKCKKWIEQARDGLRVLGIGGSAAGTGLNVPAGYPAKIVRELEKLTSEKLHLSHDLCEAMQSQSPVSYYSSMLRLTALELTRICNDLRLLASGPSTGLSEIFLPEVQPGSSIMPGKVNPSILEMANQSWYSVIGLDQTIAMCVQAGQLELNVMMPMMAYSALEATEVATNALRTLRERCVEGLRPNEPRLTKYFESTSQVATALTPRLGYEAVAKLVQESVRENRSVLEIVRERKLLSDNELGELLKVFD
jgi:aspartate ammonia-lyase